MVERFLFCQKVATFSDTENANQLFTSPEEKKTCLVFAQTHRPGTHPQGMNCFLRYSK
jgi:hypothetical protein